MKIRSLVAGAAITAIGGFCVSSAQAVEVKPTQGQSEGQMTQDIAECQALATQSSGYNPGAPPAVSSAPPQVGQERRVNTEVDQQATAQVQSQAEAYDEANSVCLSGRGYTVKP